MGVRDQSVSLAKVSKGCNEVTLLTVSRHLHKETLDTLRIIRWHGSSRMAFQESLRNADIVITTYNTLATEYKNRPSVLHDISWYRVVLDEG